MSTEPVSAVDPRRSEFPEFLMRLGAATYEAARVAGICFALARVFGSVPSEAMYNDPLGTLQRRTVELARHAPELPGLSEFLAKLQKARVTRNDVLHALPVRDGLYRRRTDDPHYVRNFFSLDDLESATIELNEAHRAGSAILYHDGGEALRRWYEAARSASS